ncbi:DNA-dependent metalloprotease SPRTN-like [Anopheles darlingi]|uniref:DNA-dependent metalloprotease SPRTN-like n=1 Tax=Anopheles darlingi TaxID=43151 RepID=UPI0021003048|nr:DNA-dependent metalloprotease SPRTN-like [Anopheles darlingi]
MGRDNDLNSTQNLVHPEWEILDPTPDIYALFPLFDRKFFQGKLACVQLEWSKKMYSCAGICYQRSNRLGKSCIIRLSEPLLKLRPRKDLVQTLLHEMIHAYCFVLGIREGNGGHGPTFKKIMNGINKIAGTHITVYHTFHDEVNVYKTHWWRCNGPCQQKQPFYGMVKRTSNRKPGPSDFWWKEHQLTCGGEFTKVREPSPKRKNARNKENDGGFFTPVQRKGPDNRIKSHSVRSPQKNVISNYFDNSISKGTGGSGNGPSSSRAIPPSKPTSAGPPSTSSSVPPKKPLYTPGARPNFGGTTLVVRKPPITVTPKTEKPATTISTEPPLTRPASVGNLRNVKQFKDLSSSDDNASPGHNQNQSSAVPLFSGRGFTLGSSSGSSTGIQPRSRLLDRFPVPTNRPSLPKKARTETSTKGSGQPSAEVIDTISLLNDSDEVFDEIDVTEVAQTVANIKKEHQDAIKREIQDSINDEEVGDDEILLIDDEYHDELADEDLASIDDSLLDRSVIDDLFNESDELMEDFNRTNAKVKIECPDDEIVRCPTCLTKMPRGTVGTHLELCYDNITGSGRPKDTRKEDKPTDDRSQTIHSVNRPSTANGTPVHSDRRRNENQPSTSRATPAQRDRNSSNLSTSSSNTSLQEASRQLLLDCGYTEEDIRLVTDDLEDNLPAADMGSLRHQVLRDSGYTEEEIARVLDETDDDDVIEIGPVDERCECPSCGVLVPISSINQHLDQCLFK